MVPPARSARQGACAAMTGPAGAEDFLAMQVLYHDRGRGVVTRRTRAPGSLFLSSRTRFAISLRGYHSNAAAVSWPQS